MPPQDQTLQDLIDQGIAAGLSDDDIRGVVEEHWARQVPPPQATAGILPQSTVIGDPEATPEARALGQLDRAVETSRGLWEEMLAHPYRTALVVGTPTALNKGAALVAPYVGPTVQAAGRFLQNPAIGGATGAISAIGSGGGPWDVLTHGVTGALTGTFLGRSLTAAGKRWSPRPSPATPPGPTGPPPLNPPAVRTGTGASGVTIPTSPQPMSANVRVQPTPAVPPRTSTAATPGAIPTGPTPMSARVRVQPAPTPPPPTSPLTTGTAMGPTTIPAAPTPLSTSVRMPAAPPIPASQVPPRTGTQFVPGVLATHGPPAGTPTLSELFARGLRPGVVAPPTPAAVRPPTPAAQPAPTPAAPPAPASPAAPAAVAPTTAAPTVPPSSQSRAARGAPRLSPNDLKVLTEQLRQGKSDVDAMAEVVRQRAERAAANYAREQQAAATRRGAKE